MSSQEGFNRAFHIPGLGSYFALSNPRVSSPNYHLESDCSVYVKLLFKAMFVFVMLLGAQALEPEGSLLHLLRTLFPCRRLMSCPDPSPPKGGLAEGGLAEGQPRGRQSIKESCEVQSFEKVRESLRIAQLERIQMPVCSCILCFVFAQRQSVNLKKNRHAL